MCAMKKPNYVTLQGMRSEVTAKFNGILGVQSTITRALVRCFVVIGNQCRGTVTHSNCHKNYVYIKCEHMKQKKCQTICECKKVYNISMKNEHMFLK